MFNIITGKVNLTDPCYATDTWCGLYDVPAKNGEWHFEVDCPDRVWSWTVWHVDHEGVDLSPMLDTDDNPVDFGVDSGQFGIFDASIYSTSISYNEPGFYKNCCDVTQGDFPYGVVDSAGFVSASGYGDGGYEGFGAFEGDQLVAFRIEFITENKYDYEDDF